MTQPKPVYRRVQIADGIVLEIERDKVEVITCPSAPLAEQKPKGPGYGVSISVTVSHGQGERHGTPDAFVLHVRQDIPGPMEFK